MSVDFLREPGSTTGEPSSTIWLSTTEHPPNDLGDGPDFRSELSEQQAQLRLLKKEVIQPHLPVQLPCYDFVPVTSPALGAGLLTVGCATSSVTGFHDVTGGVYKARERIHRGMADPRLLATPRSCRRVAACNPNWGMD